MGKASASYTIMDYTDGVTLLGSIESNLPRTILYDTTTQTRNPSWAGTALSLTPKLAKAGSPTDLVSSLTSAKWYRRVSGGDWTEVVSGKNGETVAASTRILTVSEDKLNGRQGTPPIPTDTRVLRATRGWGICSMPSIPSSNSAGAESLGGTSLSSDC